MRLALSAVVTALSLLFVTAVGAHAQVNPVYRQDPVNGNATQQQQITVPSGYNITLQSGATLACQAGASCSGGTIATGTPFTGCATNGGLLFNNNNVIGCSPSAVNLSGSLTMGGGALLTASGAGIIGAGFAFDQALVGDITVRSAGRIGFTPSTNPAVAPDTYFARTGAGVMSAKGAGGIDATLTALTQANADNSTNVATTAFVKNVVPSTTMPLTNSLGANVVMSSTASYFDGPSVAQGTSGTWFASGVVTIFDSTGALGVNCKLWDGTTIIASGTSTVASVASVPISAIISLSGYLATPAGNIRISCQPIGRTDAVIASNQSGNSKDSTLSAYRIQ